jgi:hypothetical protein
MRKRDGRPFSGVSIIFEIVPHSETIEKPPLPIEKPPFFNINDINYISFFGTSHCHHCCSIP